MKGRERLPLWVHTARPRPQSHTHLLRRARPWAPSYVGESSMGRNQRRLAPFSPRLAYKWGGIGDGRGKHSSPKACKQVETGDPHARTDFLFFSLFTHKQGSWAACGAKNTCVPEKRYHAVETRFLDDGSPSWLSLIPAPPVSHHPHHHETGQAGRVVALKRPLGARAPHRVATHLRLEGVDGARGADVPAHDEHRAPADDGGRTWLIACLHRSIDRWTLLCNLILSELPDPNRRDNA